MAKLRFVGRTTCGSNFITGASLSLVVLSFQIISRTFRNNHSWVLYSRIQLVVTISLFVSSCTSFILTIHFSNSFIITYQPQARDLISSLKSAQPDIVVQGVRQLSTWYRACLWSCFVVTLICSSLSAPKTFESCLVELTSNLVYALRQRENASSFVSIFPFLL